MNPLHTVYLPVIAGADLSAAALVWSPMDPAEIDSDRRQDGAACLSLAGRTLVGVKEVKADPVLATGLTWSVDATGVTFRVRATNPTAGARPVIQALWLLDNDDVWPVAATLPIVARAPAGLVLVGPPTVTAGLTDDAGHVLTDDAGLILIAA